MKTDVYNQEGKVISQAELPKEIFDVELSKSKVGKLSDILMDKYQAIRSLDPNFSWVGLDNSSQDLLRIDTKESFGKNSFFDKLRSVRGKAILIGVDFDALPFFMFLEKMHGVDYRYDKKFNGKICYHGKIYKDCFTAFAMTIKLNRRM